MHRSCLLTFTVSLERHGLVKGKVYWRKKMTSFCNTLHREKKAEEVKAPPPTEPVRSRSILLKDLERHVKKMDSSKGWEKELETLPPKQTQLHPWNEARLPENIVKHRYPPPEDNLLTYDHTRVVLTKTRVDLYSDFINANWIQSYDGQRRYIATQGPLDSTIGDFYRMIWQHNVHEAVALVSQHDLDNNKCAKYFPDESATYEDIEVHLQKKLLYPDLAVRIYSLKRGSHVRVLVHHHFLSWPDQGVPKDPKLLLNLIRKYRYSDTYTKEFPLLVHCSAGVGRSGTFILADIMFEMAEKEDHVDFLKHLWNLRNQRVSMVEQPEQYALAHKVVLQAYKDGLFNKTNNNENEVHEFEHNRKPSLHQKGKTCVIC